MCHVNISILKSKVENYLNFVAGYLIWDLVNTHMNSVNNFSCEFITKYHMFYLILDYFKTKYKKLNISIFLASISLLEHILACIEISFFFL